MEKLENNLIPLFKIIEEKTTITIKEWEEINKVIENCFIKIQRQRERLEQSRDLKCKERDMWKAKFMELKAATNLGKAHIREVKE